MIQLGIDFLQEQRFAALRGKRVGLLSNPSGVDRELRGTWEILWEAPDVKLTTLFGPEHGFVATAPDMLHVESGREPRSGLPIHSLFDPDGEPDAGPMSDLDAVVCDIQDVGARFYTYIWTMAALLELAGRTDLEIIVLDRPNPLGGEVVAGPLLEPGLASFAGRRPIPIQHGMTIGELAGMLNQRWSPTPARLTVIPCAGWTRAMTWDQTGLAWTPPSPAIPHLSTVRHYPGACLLEGTNLSEGCGTALPFEVAGAPWIDGHYLARRLNQNGWPGVRFRPHAFRPAANNCAGQECYGVQAHIRDHLAFRPIETWLGVIREIRMLNPDHFAWRPPNAPGTIASRFHHFDHLVGNHQVRERIDAGASLPRLIDGWDEDVRAFSELRRPYLLYR